MFWRVAPFNPEPGRPLVVQTSIGKTWPQLTLEGQGQAVAMILVLVPTGNPTPCSLAKGDGLAHLEPTTPLLAGHKAFKHHENVGSPQTTVKKGGSVL